MAEPIPLLVFSDDWGRHPSSCQHLIRHLLPHRPVTWVNTIGMQPPRWNWYTLKRGFEKLRTWLSRRPVSHPTETDSLQPQVLNPTMWPSFRSRLGRRLNRRLLTRSLGPITATGVPPVIITTLPIVADLVGRVPATRWVYYCVDDFAVWPGLDGRTLQQMEAELVPKVDVAVAVSENLQAHLAKLGKTSHLLTHGVDLDFWQKPVAGDIPVSLRELNRFPPPLIVYWGVVDRRMDVAIIRELSNRMATGTILLVGPQDNPEPELRQLPRVQVLPPVPYADLPALAARSTVLIAPYADMPVTQAMQPLKLKEYLATGKPVVVRKLPATEPWADCADVTDTPDAFAAAVLTRLQYGVPEEQHHARVRIANEGWATKALQFERWIDGTGERPA
jgi:glycosyltransferase involved in cell wall biosynthesis